MARRTTQKKQQRAGDPDTPNCVDMRCFNSALVHEEAVKKSLWVRKIP